MGFDCAERDLPPTRSGRARVRARSDDPSPSARNHGSGGTNPDWETTDLLAIRAQPIIRKIVLRKIRGASADAEDVCADVLVRLLYRIRQNRPGCINSVPDYAAAAAYNACDRYFRRKYPQRRRSRSPVLPVLAAASEDRAVPSAGGCRVENTPDPKPQVDAQIMTRVYAQGAWAELRSLPIRQRQALLFGLRPDGIELLLQTGLATPPEIAETLGMTVDRLASFWDRLPLADAETAAILGTTRQKVINLRMVARRRLANRLAEWRR